LRDPGYAKNLNASVQDDPNVVARIDLPAFCKSRVDQNLIAPERIYAAPPEDGQPDLRRIGPHGDGDDAPGD